MSNDVYNVLREKLSLIKTRYKVKEIGIFGSFAKNVETDSSDIDFLIEFESGHDNFDNYMDLKFYLEELYNRKIDLIMKDAPINQRIRANILSEVKYA